ncbi:glycosyltransferase family 39 protein [Actinocorallia sp. A-T 12471]|uniref:ArnT family glycosyltransferase n=1 Tax=Actinocorallia sp. A-T 12471 TaxID=3089813 RepID=UPI0029CE3424|nr:glycosyltransferase family 39 protein [Actinocorallia sp. A-T 12471]MDX6740266.1 glycosyltransferase family 39 protein [Actinocorallia sp. A-T 12471]
MDKGAGGPRWALPALAALLAATGALYLWGLGASGWANAYYSAAAQAGAQSWKAMFFGATDAAGAITVDKAPLALWPMALSARIFGLSSWSVLVPQALMGVGAVALLYGAVRRGLDGTTGPRAAVAGGLVAGAALATTPVAALMFRFNNPDALLVLLLVGAAYALVRAFPEGSTRWVLVAGALVGLAFLAKMLQAFLVLPGFAAAWLALAPGTLRRRLMQTLGAGLAVVAGASWWIAAVALTPTSARPYIGGSQGNSVLELALGYNGIGRLNGADYGGLGNLDQEAGWSRIFASELGGQIAWLVPAALILLVTGLLVTRGAARFSFALWGGWFVVTCLVFSFMRGIFHAYYAVALAPAVAALVGLGVAVCARRREVLSATAAVTAVWGYVLLGRTPDFVPWLRWAVVAAGLVAALLLLGRGRALAVGAAAALVAGLAGPAAYALETAATAHTGAIPTAGPATDSGGFRPRGGGGFGPGVSLPGGGAPGGGFDGGDGTSGGGAPSGASNGGAPSGTSNSNAPSGASNGGTPSGTSNSNASSGASNGGAPSGKSNSNAPSGASNSNAASSGASASGGPGGGFGGGGFGGGMRGGAGLLSAPEPDAEVVAALRADADRYTWAAAVIGSNNAAGYQLATGAPVMAVGGFNGTDPAPTLARFQKLVAEGRVHYFIESSMFGTSQNGSTEAQRIADWVAANYSPQRIVGTTVYALA